MKYMGSKNRIAKYILPIILKDRKEGQWYVEPFCGGCNLIDKVTGNRIANDANHFLIAMFKALQDGWIPPKEVTEARYKEVKDTYVSNENHIRGYIGFNLSFGGKFWGGYRRDGEGKRDYGLEAYNNIMKQVPNIIGINFYSSDYSELSIPSNSIIYCDPPYKGTTKYESAILHDRFYDWCRTKKAEGHTIFISEYEMPEDFVCVWQKEQVSSLTQDTGSKRAVEKLFTLP